MAVAVGCVKLIEPTPSFAPSTVAFSASASATTVAVAAADSTKAALTLTWNDPKFSVGLKNSKFTVRVAKVGANFATFLTKEFTNSLTGELMGKDLNAMAQKFGGVIGQPIALEMMVVASQANNNEPKNSNVLPLTVTPFSDLVLNSTTRSVVTSAANASQEGVAFSWNAGFIGFEGTRTYKLEYSKGGTNFTAITTVNVATQSKSFTQLDLNNIAALSFGVPAGSVGNIDFRIRATNGLDKVIYSNIVTVAVTPHSSKPVPKYPVPANLFLVGDASPSGWDNPVATPSQQFTRIDDNTFGMIIQLTGGKQYLLLPVNGSWSNKYSVSVATNAANPNGDSFQPDAPNNIPGPANSGLYKIIVDFVAGTYAVTPVSTNPIPPNLFMVGDATPGGWDNPVPTPSQQFTRLSNGEFQLILPLTTGKSYLFLPVNGSWANKFGGTSATGGDLLVDGNVPGSNTPAPSASGSYKINVNFLTMKYSVTLQ